MRSIQILSSLLAFTFFLCTAVFSQEEKSLADEVDILYAQWGEECESVKFSSNSYDYYKQPSFQEIIQKGIKVIPVLMRKVEKNNNLGGLCIMQGIEDILDMKFVSKGPIHYLGSDDLLYWWETERFEIEDRFNELYGQWIALDKEEKFKKPFTFDWKKEYADEFARMNEALKRHHELPEEQRDKENVDINKYLVEYKKAMNRWREMPEGPEKERLRPYNRTTYQRLLDFGIPALPFAIQKINQGDYDLFEAVMLWTDSALPEFAAEKQQDWGSNSIAKKVDLLNQWWEANQKQYTLPGKYVIDPALIKAMSK
ncbi:MAG: hypothetical protein P9L94_02995 [Candidatus Hinthialibacter antarcticus]|nr:hypothetical protein [Candidatus Hinthialibacter antarcticus]